MTARRNRACSLLTALAAAAVVLTACSDDDPTGAAPSSGATPTPVASSPAPAATAAPTETAAPSPPGSGTRAVAVYYVADTTNGPRLYREFHRRPAGSDPVADAVTAMLTVPALDRDYTSLWPRTTRVLSTRRDGTTRVVDLSGDARNGSAGAAYEGASVDQLVWTTTAADPSARAVRLLIEGREVADLWGHIDARGDRARGNAAVQLGPVWILTPTQGASLPTGGTFGGEASVFEATVSWEVLAGTRVVAKGFSTATAGAPARGRWTATLPAAVTPGRYVLKAFEASAQDGRDTFVDTKDITVR